MRPLPSDRWQRPAPSIPSFAHDFVHSLGALRSFLMEKRQQINTSSRMKDIKDNVSNQFEHRPPQWKGSVQEPHITQKASLMQLLA